MGFLRLEHRLLEEFKRRSVADINILVAVSGGADSVALVSLLKNIAPALNFEIYLGHVHHGWLHGEQGAFRLKAWKHCHKLSQKLGLKFYSNLLEVKPELRFLTEPEVPLRSEDDMRRFRYKCLYKFKQQLQESSQKPTFIATAHTASDQLETRLIHLIRGAGVKGVEAMSFQGEEDLLRPLLACTRDELCSYLKEIKMDYIDDPSNLSIDPFRNWLRNQWLNELEKKRPGSIHSLSRSLQHLSEAKNASVKDLAVLILEDRISMALFLELSFEDKKRLLALFMRHRDMKNYGNSHILEVIKRLDSAEKEHSFTLLKHVWSVNLEYIKASPV